MSRQSRFDARYWMLGVGALGRPRGMVRGGRREEGSGWGTRVYLWQIHVDIWQNKYNIVKLKNKIKIKKQTKILHAKSLQSCPTLRDPRDGSPPGSPVPGILQAKILEWVAMPSSRGSSQPRDVTLVSYVSCIGKQVLYH